MGECPGSRAREDFHAPGDPKKKKTHPEIRPKCFFAITPHLRPIYAPSTPHLRPIYALKPKL
ncbi:hypothetical protein NQZ68_017239 [Dissostichus eleginoides]|nr:hypothetical protein NQZ68_017239 [Dissostichus eleginoides]